MLKVGGKRKRKERKKEKNHTNSIARIRACASPPAVSFACLKLHHAAKGKKYQSVRSLNIMSRSITRPTVLKRNTSHAVSNANKGKKSDVNRANIFYWKKIKAEESMTFQNIFSSMADFRDVLSVLLAAQLIKASKYKIFVAVQKANRP